jgi:ADP-ribose pyrophosphatase YjhB (NUDIX family)
MYITHKKLRVAAIILRNSEILLSRREAGKYWALPGGAIEPHEQSGEALEREMQEEIGTKIGISRLVWIVENFFTDEQSKFHEVLFVYLASLKHTPTDAMNIYEQTHLLGKEGSIPVVFQWHDMASLERLCLFPSFLRSRLTSLPSTLEHIIAFD